MNSLLQKSTGLLAWGWPKGSIDLLLCAAAHADDAAAGRAWHEWSRRTNLETDLSYREMRLLAAVAPRLSKLDPEHVERNRVLGVERSLWSRTHLLLHEMSASFEKLGRANIEIMVLKGAARVARDRRALKHRFVNDVDLLVHPSEFRRAFDILAEDGWKSTLPGTEHYHRSRLDAVHGMNLIRGQLADLDLHRSAFHQPHESLDEDQQMWARSLPGILANRPVRVPSPTDSFVVALAHGAQIRQQTSDWMLDIVDALSTDDFDWNLLGNLIERRRLVVPAAVVLTYLAERLQLPVPEPVLNQIVSDAKKSRIDLLAHWVLSHPRNQVNLPLVTARWAAKKWWLRRREPIPATRRLEGTVVNAKARWIAAPQGSPSFVSTSTISISDRGPNSNWQGVVEGTIAVPVSKGRRKIEFELRAGSRHVVRIRHRRWIARRGIVTLSFRAAVNLTVDDGPLVLASAPARGLRVNAAADQCDRYSALPFHLVEVVARATSLKNSRSAPLGKVA